MHPLAARSIGQAGAMTDMNLDAEAARLERLRNEAESRIAPAYTAAGEELSLEDEKFYEVAHALLPALLAERRALLERVKGLEADVEHAAEMAHAEGRIEAECEADGQYADDLAQARADGMRRAACGGRRRWPHQTSTARRANGDPTMRSDAQTLVTQSWPRPGDDRSVHRERGNRLGCDVASPSPENSGWSICGQMREQRRCLHWRRHRWKSEPGVAGYRKNSYFACRDYGIS